MTTKKICTNNQAFVCSREAEEKKKLDAQTSECRSLVAAMTDYIRNPQSHKDDYARFQYSGGFECDFKEMIRDINSHSNILVRVENGVLASDNKWWRQTKSQPSYRVDRTVVGDRVEYTII